MIKAAFFDIDGTLLSFETHRMPDSTVRAIEALRAAGVKTVISSGRPTYEIPEELRHGFDAYITMNGQMCYDAEGVFRSKPIDETDARAVVALAEAGEFDLLTMHLDRSFVNRCGESVAAIQRNVGLTYQVDSLERAFDKPIYQFCAFTPSTAEGKILEVTQNVAITRWTEHFCDVVPAAGGKAYGVRAVLERYGIGADEAIAFGDGENDLSMFGEVGTSVAMGNAWDGVKERATYVTDHVDADGIWNACRHLGLV